MPDNDHTAQGCVVRMTGHGRLRLGRMPSGVEWKGRDSRSFRIETQLKQHMELTGSMKDVRRCRKARKA
jgi:hypothetical protein